MTKVVDDHASNKYHTDLAVEAALAFKRSIEQPHVNVDVCLNLQLYNAIQENRHILNCAQCILWQAMHC